MHKITLLLGIVPLFLSADPESGIVATPFNEDRIISVEPSAPEQTPAGPEQPDFWMTGPLIIPSEDIIEFGHIVYQPYLFWTRFKDTYNSHWKSASSPLFTTVAFQPFTRFGIFPRGEFDIYPTVAYNHTEHVHDWVWQDMPVNLNVLVMEEDPDRWYKPLVWVGLISVAPWGQYQKLDPKKLGTDIGGTGSWLPGAGLSLYHDFYLYGPHYFSVQAFFSFQYGAPVHVKGLNYYGGDADTRGKVFPGNINQAIVSFQYALTHRWVVALDNVYIHQNKTRFKGHTSPDAPMASPSSEAFSMAPALEYCWSENFGIVGGAWFTVAGRNTDKFVSGIISIYISK